MVKTRVDVGSRGARVCRRGMTFGSTPVEIANMMREMFGVEPSTKALNMLRTIEPVSQEFNYVILPASQLRLEDRTTSGVLEHARAERWRQMSLEEAHSVHRDWSLDPALHGRFTWITVLHAPVLEPGLEFLTLFPFLPDRAQMDVLNVRDHNMWSSDYGFAFKLG